MSMVKDTLPNSGNKRPLRCFGAHMSIAGGVHNALRDAQRLCCQTVQVFVKNQRQWTAPPLAPDDVAQWRTLAERSGLAPLVAHATYLINLASPDRTLWRKSVDAFVDELRRCAQLGIDYLVVHPGAAMDAPRIDAVRRVARALTDAREQLAGAAVMPLLETTAGQGTTLGSTFEELAEILEHVDDPEQVGICMDTCHVFAAGYDIRDAGQYAAMVESIDRTVGVSRVRCWHLNDSKGACGSRLDRHEHIGHGQIGTAGFRNVLGDPRFAGLPMILETPKGENANGREWDRVNLQRLRTIATRVQRQD